MKEILVSFFWEEGKECFSPLFIRQFEEAVGWGCHRAVWSVHRLAYSETLHSLFTELKKYDAAERIIGLENACLFSFEGENAIETVLRYLEHFNCGEYPQAEWAYLDELQNAIVNFTFDGLWQARLYCQSDEEAQALHWIEDLGFIGVEFVKDISEYRKATDLAGNFCLRKYMPREIGDLLSKKAKVKHPAHAKADEACQSKRLVDNHDSL